MGKEITIELSWTAKRIIEKHAEELGTTLESMAADVLEKHFVAEQLRKEIPYMSDNARGVLKILAKSENYVSRALLVEKLDIKNDRGLSYVLAYMTSYSSFFTYHDFIESRADELRLPDHLRKVVLSAAGRNY